MKRTLALLLAAALSLSLVACGGSAGADTNGGAATAPSSPSASSPSYGFSTDTPAEKGELSTNRNDAADMDAPTPDTGAAGESGSVPSGQKLIRTAHLQMESTEFDAAVTALEELTAKLGGYYEQSSISNYHSNQRWGEYTIRIPAQQFQAFLDQAGDLCHVTRQESSQDDVSEIYYDTAGRLKTQQIKLERLQQLLAKAEKMEDIITIESAISETEWAIEDLSGTLRHYDGKVNYATVHVTLSEVYKLSDVEQVPDSFGSRMKSAFSRGMRNFLNTLEDLAVSFAYSWVWWLLLIAAAAVVITFVRVKGRKLPGLRRKKKDTPEDKQ